MRFHGCHVVYIVVGAVVVAVVVKSTDRQTGLET
jgi:hypothetical protein